MASEPLSHLETAALADQRVAAVNCRPKNAEDRDVWNKFIDETLVGWRHHPELFEDDGIDAPSGAAIAAASKAACLLRDQGAPAPTNCSPTGDGGIALHYQHQDVLFTIEYGVDGHRELRFHFAGQLVRLDDSAVT